MNPSMRSEYPQYKSSKPHLEILLHCRSSLQQMSLWNTFLTLIIMLPLVEGFQGFGEAKLLNFSPTDLGITYLPWRAVSPLWDLQQNNWPLLFIGSRHNSPLSPLICPTYDKQKCHQLLLNRVENHWAREQCHDCAIIYGFVGWSLPTNSQL